MTVCQQETLQNEEEAVPRSKCRMIQEIQPWIMRILMMWWRSYTIWNKYNGRSRMAIYRRWV
jgi:hypothetical protein